MVSFSLAWKNIKHREIKNFFYDDSTNKIQTHVVDGEEKRINAFSLFESNIEPKWEDPTNKYGGEFRIDFTTNSTTVQELWETLVYKAITSDFPDSDKLCGVRLLDKSQNDRPGIFRIEIWTKLNDSSCDEYKNMHNYI